MSRRVPVLGTFPVKGSLCTHTTERAIISVDFWARTKVEVGDEFKGMAHGLDENEVMMFR